MKNAIYWNHLWLNVTECAGKESNLSEDIKVMFYELIEPVIVHKGEHFLTTEDLNLSILKMILSMLNVIISSLNMV